LCHFKKIKKILLPIYRDAAEVEGGDGGRVHVHRVPEVTHEEAEVPPPRDLHGRLEGHREERDKEVGEGEADQEVVVDMTKTTINNNRNDDQNIVDNGEDDDGDDDGTLEDEEGELQLGVFLLSEGTVMV
jgi:hypothetical protein